MTIEYVTISLLPTLAAIIAPIITAFITCRYNTKIKHMELITGSKLSAMESFSSSYKNYADKKDEFTLLLFTKRSYQLILLCKSNKTKIAILELLNTLEQDKSTSEKSDKLFTKCLFLIANKK